MGHTMKITDNNENSNEQSPEKKIDTAASHGKRRKTFLIIGGLLIIAAMVTLSVVMRHRDKLPEVEWAAVTSEDFIHEVSANGEIASETRTLVYCTVTAKIQHIPASIGDRIEQGEVLALLDKESLENSLISAENALENVRMTVRGELLSLRTSYTGALTSRDQALREYRRAGELHKIGSVSDEELRRQKEALLLAEETLTSVRQKLNFREGRPLDDPRTEAYLDDDRIVDRAPEVRRAEIELNNIRKSLDDYMITAETSGVITDLPLEEGGMVAPVTLVAKIQDPDALLVTVGIDEVDLSYVAVGQPVRILSDSFINRELPGRVTDIAPIIRKVGDSRVCEIDVRFSRTRAG